MSTELQDDLYSIAVTTIDGKESSMAQYKGKVLLIVNVASKCGHTPQYAELEALYKKYKERGLVVLGFPCNQFGGQEPGSEEQIKEFCSLNYNVTFPMFSKVKVNSKTAHPLFQFLKTRALGILGTEAIKWNFTKFLVDRNGNVIDRYASKTKAAEFESEIVKLL